MDRIVMVTWILGAGKTTVCARTSRLMIGAHSMLVNVLAKIVINSNGKKRGTKEILTSLTGE